MKHFKHFKPTRNRSPTTTLDLLCGTLAQVTGKPQDRFRQVFCQAIESGHLPADRLLSPADPALHDQLLAEKSGILNWLMEGQFPTT